ncbi:hypothetical protein H9P43_006381 [Blastocladiella emersonii ATCC 22665]|nr:hypothetical protein H9P43_006381 [Blastocladiella emersonii ATCC 22665]
MAEPPLDFIQFAQDDVTREYVDEVCARLGSRAAEKLKFTPDDAVLDGFLADPKVFYRRQSFTLEEYRAGVASGRFKQKGPQVEHDDQWCGEHDIVDFTCPLCHQREEKLARSTSEIITAIRTHLVKHVVFKYQFRCPGQFFLLDNRPCGTFYHSGHAEDIHHHWRHVYAQWCCQFAYFRLLARNDPAARLRITALIGPPADPPADPPVATGEPMQEPAEQQLARRFVNHLNGEPKAKFLVDFDVDVAPLFAGAPAEPAAAAATASGSMPAPAAAHVAAPAVHRAGHLGPELAAEVAALLDDSDLDTLEAPPAMDGPRPDAEAAPPAPVAAPAYAYAPTTASAPASLGYGHASVSYDSSPMLAAPTNALAAHTLSAELGRGHAWASHVAPMPVMPMPTTPMPIAPMPFMPMHAVMSTPVAPMPAMPMPVMPMPATPATTLHDGHIPYSSVGGATGWPATSVHLAQTQTEPPALFLSAGGPDVFLSASAGATDNDAMQQDLGHGDDDSGATIGHHDRKQMAVENAYFDQFLSYNNVYGTSAVSPFATHLTQTQPEFTVTSLAAAPVTDMAFAGALGSAMATTQSTIGLRDDDPLNLCTGSPPPAADADYHHGAAFAQHDTDTVMHDVGPVAAPAAADPALILWYYYYCLAQPTS